MSIQPTTQSSSASNFVVYSPNESSIGDGAGFWSNEFGWVEFAQATVFTEEESQTLNLPISTGHDATWNSWPEANRSYGGM